jgi:hypothetical protein
VISWKNSFKRLNEEYELAKKKKQAVDNLYITGKISQFTRDSFNTEISATIVDIERQQKDLLSKMQLKTDELSCQIKTLETLLANYEIQYVIGEIEEAAYQRDSFLFTAGIDAAKNELETIKQATMQLCPPVPTVQAPAPPESPVTPSTIETPVMECTPQQEATPVEFSLPIEVPVESTSIETQIFEAAPASITETPEEQTFTAEAPMVEESVMDAPLFEESPMVEESVMESTIFEETPLIEESVPIASADIVVDEPAIEIATTDPIFLTNESIVEAPVMDYAPIEEAPIETVSVIEAPIEEIATVTTDDIIVADVPLQVFEVTEQAPVEQTLEKVMEQLTSPVVETLTVEELTHDSHPSTAPHQAHSDIIAEAVSDGQIEESDEDTTE